MRDLVLAGLLLGLVACAIQALRYHARAAAHRRPGVPRWRAYVRPGAEDPALYTEQGLRHQRTLLRYQGAAVAFGIAAVLVHTAR
jgi:hypothetical protein